jgi:hypothetical protein
MPDAFGNIWPQYARGWQQMYAPPAGAVPVNPAVPVIAPQAAGGGPVVVGGGPMAVGGAPFVGQPMGGANYPPNYYPDQPERNRSELGQGDTGALASSGGGEPQSRYQMGGFNPGLTSVGGFAGAGGSVESGLAPAQSLTSSLMPGGGGGGTGGAGGGGGGLFSGLQNLFGQGPSSGAGAAGTGVGGSGISQANLASAITGILSSFANLDKQANAPVTVSPSLWANPPPAPATFSWPQLAPNVGGVWY